jgi:uncharacterized membrane protein YdjX (TVP38/TMEM64 family)
MKNKSFQRVIIGCSISLVIIALNVILWHSGFSLSSLKAHVIALDHAVQAYQPLSSLIYVVAFVIAIALWIPITVVMTIAAGYFFGLLKGIIIASLGATLGCLCSFLLSRYLFRNAIMRKWHKQLALINYELKQFGGYYLFMLHALPLTPTPLLNLLAGVTAVSPLTYAWASFLGMFPAVVAYVLAGRRLHEIHAVGDIMSLEFFIITIILLSLAFLPFLFRRLGMKLPKI